MKRVVIFIVFINLFCANVDQSVLDEIPKFETREEAMHWVHDNVAWTLREDIDNWQSPEETMTLKTGVCSDMSILLMYIFKTQFGDEPLFLLIHINGSVFNHAIVESNNLLYDPANIDINYQYKYLFYFEYKTTISISQY